MTGFCGSGEKAVIARAAPHMWEEPVISGKKGSGAVFFSGCTMRCAYCQNFEISALRQGIPVNSEKLADILKSLEESGVHNINLVTGTHYTPAIIRALEIYKPKIPVVWNSSGYESLETIRLLAEHVDIWLPDFKYADEGLSVKYSKAHDYPEIAKKAIGLMIKYSGENVIEDGIIKRGTIIRHLVLPENTRNSIAVLDIIAQNFPNTPVSLMCQYVPMGNAQDFRELNRRITRREYDKVCRYLFDLGLDGFVQEHGAADKSFIPNFNEINEY